MEYYPRTMKLTHRAYVANVWGRRNCDQHVGGGVASQTTETLLEHSTAQENPLQNYPEGRVQTETVETYLPEEKTTRKQFRCVST